MGTEACSGWSSLPFDLVRRIAGCFLETNDLDCYMSFRAVCPSWRAATATDDPKKNAFDVRFHPRRWIVLDETQGKLLLCNTDTGRFLHRELPLLSDCYIVAITTRGFVLLADRRPPHAVYSVFNPVTGVLIRISAPPGVLIRFSAPPGGGALNLRDFSIALLLRGDEDYREAHKYFQTISWCTPGPLRVSGPGFDNLWARARLLSGLLYHHDGVIIPCYVDMLEPLPSITTFAIFVGPRTCLPIDSTKFPAIEANSIYYTQRLGSSAIICKWTIEDQKAERVYEADDFVKQGEQFFLVAARPFTLIQLLCSYTISCRDSQLALQEMS